MPSPLISDEGMDYIALTCSRSGAYFLPRPRQDIGIDAHIEFRNEQCQPTGAIALIQCKAGLSHISPSGKYRISADKSHFQIWSQYTLPVIGIIYNPETRDAQWVSITEHIQSHPNCIQTGPYVIYAPKDQPFSLEGFAKFQSYITACHNRLGTDSAQKLIDRYFRGDIIQKYECLVQLFSTYRWTPLSCFFFHQALRLEEEPPILHALTYIISYYRPYAWRLSGTMPEHDTLLRSLAQKCFAGFGKAEVLKMLSTIDDENGLNQGGNGWLVAIELRYISNIEDVLCDIAKDRTLEPQIRGHAVQILASFLGYVNTSFYQSLLQHENDRFVIETLYWALEWGMDKPEESLEGDHT